MPQFILDHGSADAARTFANLDAFTQGYLEAAFFTEEEQLNGGSIAELAPIALASAIADCEAFMNTPAFRRLGVDMCDGVGNEQPDNVHAGRDFWYTRNGHGCGFWDGDWDEPYASELSEAARAFGSVDMYRDDDEQVYFS